MRRIMWGSALLGGAAFLAACGEEPDATAAGASTGGVRGEYSRNITREVNLKDDMPLVQVFCKNTTGADCPTDIGAKLEAYGFSSKGPGVDLAMSFVAMAADAKDGMADQKSSDEDFFAASYRVVLSREPDMGGAQTNLTFIKDTGQRKAMVRSLLESDEFKQGPQKPVAPGARAITAPEATPSPAAVPAPAEAAEGQAAASALTTTPAEPTKPTVTPETPAATPAPAPAGQTTAPAAGTPAKPPT